MFFLSWSYEWIGIKKNKPRPAYKIQFLFDSKHKRVYDVRNFVCVIQHIITLNYSGIYLLTILQSKIPTSLLQERDEGAVYSIKFCWIEDDDCASYSVIMFYNSSATNSWFIIINWFLSIKVLGIMK